MADPKRERAITARDNSSKAKYRKPKNGTGTGEGLPRIGSPEHCWCGKLAGHYWPGATEGAPHPR